MKTDNQSNSPTHSNSKRFEDYRRVIYVWPIWMDHEEGTTKRYIYGADSEDHPDQTGSIYVCVSSLSKSWIKSKSIHDYPLIYC